jgi:hypothetical protein
MFSVPSVDMVPAGTTSVNRGREVNNGMQSVHEFDIYSFSTHPPSPTDYAKASTVRRLWRTRHAARRNIYLELGTWNLELERSDYAPL